MSPFGPRTFLPDRNVLAGQEETLNTEGKGEQKDPLKTFFKSGCGLYRLNADMIG